jgi:hypothetical protein
VSLLSLLNFFVNVSPPSAIKAPKKWCMTKKREKIIGPASTLRRRHPSSTRGLLVFS